MHLPWGKAAARQFGEPSHSAIGLGCVRGNRQHRVIDEELVRLIRPTQRLQERRTNMTHDFVVMADA